MKLTQTLFHLITFITAIQALAFPGSSENELYKRKGGGGGRGGGGSVGGGRTSSGSSGSSGSRGSSSSSTPPTRGYGGGSYYAGGAATPYRAGNTGAWRGPAPLFLGVGALALFPGLWLYGAYAYRYNDDEPVTYLNETTGRNETRPVTCLCAQYDQCGCEDDQDQEFFNEIANNKEVSFVENGTLYINGTLDNDTAASSPAAAGPAGSLQRLVEASGYWPILAGVAYTMWFL